MNPYEVALAAVLDTLEDEGGEPVARGRRALAMALAWTRRTRWSEIAWRFSDLADGLPVELVWRPGRSGFAWTAEPAAPEWPAPRRLARALAIAARIGGPADAGMCEEATALAARIEAPWPVWIAGRHDMVGNTAKLYVRLTDNRPARIAPVLRGDDRPMMLGLANGDIREFYWRRIAREPGDRYRFHHAAMGVLAEQLDAALSDWTGMRLDDENGGRLGLSARWAGNGAIDTLAAFLRVGSAGGAGRVRDRLCAIAGTECAFARLWRDGRVRPMLLTLAATRGGMQVALGFTLPR